MAFRAKFEEGVRASKDLCDNSKYLSTSRYFPTPLLLEFPLSGDYLL